MKQLQVSFDGTYDPTGYLFSLAKCLSASIRCSPYRALADDIVASSGFAFRMWVDGAQLCPSAMSIWEFAKQKPWVENGGLSCGYVQRLWDEDAVEAQRRLAAQELIEASVETGTAPVVWDVSGGEWGLITGCDREARLYETLKIDGTRALLPYDRLGKLEIPILSVLTVTGRTDKSAAQILADTKKLAASHLRGEEWCENAKGLAAYDALMSFVREKLTTDAEWNLQYYLGTYAGLKWYAWQFFAKYRESELEALYKTVYESWKRAFDLSCTDADAKEQIAALLETAKDAEAKALQIMA